MAEVTIKNILRRANKLLARENERVVTTKSGRDKGVVGRWYLVDETNRVRAHWSDLTQLEVLTRELGVLGHNDVLVENYQTTERF
jgi:hypothetical protein